MKGLVAVLIVSLLLLLGCKQVVPATPAGQVDAVFQNCLRHAAGSSGDAVSAEVTRECRLLAENVLRSQTVVLGGGVTPCPEPKETQ